MLIVEEYKKFTKFGSAVSSYHECIVYITEPNFWFFGIFLRAFFKMFHKDVGDYKRNRRAIVAPYSKLIVTEEVNGC